jgi:amino acid adenylation domain-containing protein
VFAADRLTSTVAGPVRRIPPGGWWELFEHRAAACPARTALVADEVDWTFHELDVWSNRLAHALRDCGAGPGMLVECATTRSALAVVAQIAIGKTGATYLPIDPALPAVRLCMIRNDARPGLLVTDIPALAGADRQVVLDAAGWQRDLAGYSDSPLGQTAAGPAYVIYTSGSTGRPNGVVVGNRSLVNLYRELATWFPRRPRRVAHSLPWGFDASWNPLLWMVGGHELHLVPDDIRTNAERYVGFARCHRLSVLEAVPAQVMSLADAGLLADDARPELLLLGGEAVSQALWSQLRATPGLTTMNLYGPTECTVVTTACRLAGRDTPAIGRPIGNARACVVDPELRPVPPGDPGELLVGGAGVAVGYLDRSELTEQRFVGRSQRWYRTGDRCRQLPDGDLKWLGRLDQQVKIRGNRVEPGEAEHALLAIPGVRQAMVRAEGEATGARLVAYVVLDDTAHGADLRQRLRVMLSDYLVPTEIVPLDALPVGVNGKIDRAVSPRRAEESLTPAQKFVAAAFRDVLGAAVVDAESDFFDLGGHSLTAAALAARLRASGVPCSLREVLRRRTVALLAELVPDRRETS